MSPKNIFPEIIINLPKADISIKGLNSYIFQGDNQQIIFMHFENDVEVPAHSHEAQWGVAIDGEIEIIIDGKKHTLKKGDEYYIPKNIVHSAKAKAGYRELVFFNQKDRYKIKANT